MYAVRRVKGARNPRVDPQPGDTPLPVSGDSRSVVARNGDCVEIHVGTLVRTWITLESWQRWASQPMLAVTQLRRPA
jgi:hypothetical protein